MSNKKDRWSALSMKERADLMNMYITNGISDLKEIKKHYNSFSGENNIYEIAPSVAINYNRNSDKAGFLLPSGGTPENPEFVYPEELQEAVVTASADDFKRKQVENQVSKMMSNNDWIHRSIGAGAPENPASVHGREYTRPLVNSALIGIGGAMATSLGEPIVRGMTHAAKVIMNPATAETTLGSILGTGAQAKMTYDSLEGTYDLVNKWKNGEFDSTDIPQMIMYGLDVVPFVNTTMKAIDKIGDTATSIYNATKKAANTKKVLSEIDTQHLGNINSIDDVTLDPYAKSEVPESAFTSKANPIEEVKNAIIPSKAEQASLAEKELYQKFLNAINRNDININTSTGDNIQIENIKNALQKAGIAEQLLTEDNIKKLIEARRLDYSNQNISDVMALRHNINGRDDNFLYDLYRMGDDNPVGDIKVFDYGDNYTTVSGEIIPEHIRPEMVRNTSNGKYKGVSEQGYNAVIGDLGHIDSGMDLLSPSYTTAVQDKYADKSLLGMFGKHNNSFEDFPVYRLNTPTYDVPVKYLDDFGLEGVSPEGKFIINFDEGPTYKNGGRLFSGEENTQTTPINYMYNPKGYSNAGIFKLPTEGASNMQADLYKMDKEGEDITFNDDGDMVVVQKQMTPEEQVEYNRIKYGYDPRLGYQKSMTPEEIAAKQQIIDNAVKLGNSTQASPLNVNKQDMSVQKLEDATNFLHNWYSDPTTKSIVEKQVGVKPFKIVNNGEIQTVNSNDPNALHVETTLSYPSAYSDLKNDELGVYDPKTNNIRVDNAIKGSYQVLPTLIHEYNHAIQDRLGLYQQPSNVPYNNRQNEIHSNLMEVRKMFGLDPSKRNYTPEEGEQMLQQLKAKTSSDSNGANNFFLNLHPITGATLAKYLNTYADASSVIDDSMGKLPDNIKALQSFNMDDGVYSAKNGGRLNLFSGKKRFKRV